MKGPELLALLPFLVLGSTAVLLLILLSFHRSHASSAWAASAGLILSFAAILPAAAAAPVMVTTLLAIDRYALFYTGLIILASITVLLISYGYNRARSAREEFYLLVVLGALGASALVASRHFASFFLGLEILTVSLYALIAFEGKSGRGGEAGIKYLVLAGLSSAFLLFGMALVYFQAGAMEFGEIFREAAKAEEAVLITAGLALIAAGLGFKLALFPFHMWTSDVYEGAPAPVAAFIATVSKGAVFALMLRYFGLADMHAFSPVFSVFAAIAVLSMFAGNFLALLQDNIKRMLAYSSIAHMGYLLVAFLSSGPLSVTAAGFYLSAYFVSMLGAFGAITLLSDGKGDREHLDAYRGLARTSPLLCGVFAGMLFSLAGIPLTAGFVGKFYLAAAGIGSALWLLVLALAVNSAISLFYYLRIVAALYAPAPEGVSPAPAIPVAGGAALAVLTVLLVFIGIYPSPLIALLQASFGLSL